MGLGLGLRLGLGLANPNPNPNPTPNPNQVDRAVGWWNLAVAAALRSSLANPLTMTPTLT